jgi:SAM-dependent methyltransferase
MAAMRFSRKPIDNRAEHQTSGRSLDVLVRNPETREIFIVSGGAKRLIPSMEAFEALGYELSWVRDVQPHVLNGIPDAPIDGGRARAFDNSIDQNREQWADWDWSRGGEEWTVSAEWKQALVDEILLRYIQPGKTVLEIGPGAGRWTEALQRISERVIVVDLTEQAIDVCRSRFASSQNIEYHVNDGRSLPFQPNTSLDYVWSFDVFVHISPPDIDSYLGEFARALRPRGVGVIHHAREGGRHGGLRSAVTAESFAALVEGHGMKVLAQIDSWGPNGQFDLSSHKDIITVFQK